MIESLNEKYEKEAFEVKMKHILERKVCHFKGLQKTLKHNAEKKKNERCPNSTVKKETPFKVMKTESLKKKNVEIFEDIEIPDEPKWKPSTTKADIEKIIQEKKLKIKSRHRSITKVKVFCRKLKAGDVIPYLGGEFGDTITLQRYIHKSGRWRVKLENGEVIRMDKEAIALLFRAENRCNIEFESVDMETINKAIEEVENALNDSCYVKVLKKILMILKPNIEFNFDVLYDLCVSQNIESLFDDLDQINIQVVDQILNVYDLQLKYFCPKSTHTTDLLEEVLKMYEEPTYLAVIWYENHYYVLGKWNHNFFLYDPLQKHPIRCYYRDVIEFIEEGAKFFWVQDLDFSYNLSDWLWDLYVDDSVTGGVRKRQLNSDTDASDTSTFENDDPPRPNKRSKIESQKEKENSEDVPLKKKRISMKGWTEEAKEARRKELRKIRNAKRKKRPEERKRVNRKDLSPESREKHDKERIKRINDRRKKRPEERVNADRKQMTQEEREIHDKERKKRNNDKSNPINNAKRKKRPEERVNADRKLMTQEGREIHDKMIKDLLNKRHNPKNNAKRIVKPEDRKYRDLSGLSVENKIEEQKHIEKIYRKENEDQIKEKQEEYRKHNRVRYYEKRLENKNKKTPEHLLCCGLYISRSEALYQYDNYCPKIDRIRLQNLYPKAPESEIDYLQKVNEYSQIKYYGGWRDEEGKYCGDGDEESKSSPKQKIHRDSEGDYYICPYCTSYRFPGEVESEKNKKVYRWDCCHNGTFRTLIELEKIRPESKFAKYIYLLLFS